MRSITLPACLLALLAATTVSTQANLESDKFLVIEAESTTATTSFAIETDVPDFKGSSYLRSLLTIGSPGLRSLSYPVQITNAGTYQLALRSRIGAGTSTSAATASFIRLLDASGNAVQPVDNSNVAINGWYSVYTNALDAWAHETSNGSETPRSLAWQLKAGGQYAVEISPQSRDHLIDRIILWETSAYNLANTLTGQNPDEAALNSLTRSDIWTYPGDLTQPDDIFPLLHLVMTWQALNEVDGPRNMGIIGWKHATFYTGVMELYRATGNSEYLDYLRDISIENNWTMLIINNSLWRHADNHLMGETFINLYIEDGEQDPQRVAHVTGIFDRMIAEPWSGRELYDWCDALFMSPPVWAQLASLYQDNRYLEELDRLWWDATDFLYDPEWKLYFRDASYFNSVEANGKPTFWGRGNGWVMGALVRVLEYMRHDWPQRAAYVDLFTTMANQIGSLQMPSGGWSSSLLYPERYGFETEVSGSAFFVYALAWGINKGLLDEATFGPIVEKGWMEMNNYVTQDGGIQHIQIVGKEPGPVDDNLAEREYGYGAFILAGVEMAEYYSTRPAATWMGYEVVDYNGFRWADTGDFLGALEVSNAPFVYSDTLRGWIHINEPQQSAAPNGSWVFIYR